MNELAEKHGWTFKKRLGRRNIDRIPVKEGFPNEGHIFEWWTRGGYITIFPDQWDDESWKDIDGNKMRLERIPDDIEAYEYGAEPND